MRILHLTIKKKWFDLIAKGEKPREYREIKQHWISRLFTPAGTAKEFDEIHIRNGYSPNSPFMRVKWNGWQVEEYEGVDCYGIDVSHIIEITNWEA